MAYSSSGPGMDEDTADGIIESQNDFESDEEPRNYLPFIQRAGYSVGHVLNDLCAAIWFSYLLVYFVSVLSFSQTKAGFLLMVGQVADGLATTFVGLQAEKLEFFNYGKKKSWHLLGTICVLFSFPLIFNPCIGCDYSSENGKLFYFSAFIIVFQFGWAAVQISHLSLVTDLTPSSSERTSLNSSRYSFTVMSNISVYLIMWVILGKNVHNHPHTNDSCSSNIADKIGPQDVGNFRLLVWVIILIGALFVSIFHFIVKEHRPICDGSGNGFCRETQIDFGNPVNHLKWYHWFLVPQFYLIGLVYMGTRLTINLTQIYISFYLEYTLDLSSDSIAYIPLVMYVSGFVASTVIPHDHLNKKVTFTIGSLLSIITFVWLRFSDGDYFTSYGIYLVAILLGASGGTMLINALGLTNDLIAHNTSSGAFVFGLMSLLDKISNGAAVSVLQYINPCDTCHCNTPEFYRDVLVYVCGVSTLIALLGLVVLIPVKLGPKLGEHGMSCGTSGRRRRLITEESEQVISDDGPLVSNEVKPVPS